MKDYLRNIIDQVHAAGGKLKVDGGKLLVAWPDRTPVPGLAELLHDHRVEVAFYLMFDGQNSGRMTIDEYRRRTDDAPHVAGWFNGAPIIQGTHRQWRDRCRRERR